MEKFSSGELDFNAPYMHVFTKKQFHIVHWHHTAHFLQSTS